MTVPHDSMRIGIHSDGRRNFSTMLLGTSNTAYGKKKTVRQRLYCADVSFRSVWRPATRAFPTLIQSALSFLSFVYSTIMWKWSW
jgi:hypothetical protein